MVEWRATVAPALRYAAAGALLGLLIAEVTDVVLLEVSQHWFFSIVFGIFFILLGAVVGFKIYSGEGASRATKIFSVVLAVLAVVSGVWCFLLNEESGVSSLGFRVVMYIMLGAMMSFLLTFSLVEIINFAAERVACCAFVPQKIQIGTLLLASGAVGAVFGLIFGLDDATESDPSNVLAAFADSQKFVLPTGIVVGILLGLRMWWLSRADGAAQPSSYVLAADDDL